jgi:hypothetical protein
VSAHSVEPHILREALRITKEPQQQILSHWTDQTQTINIAVLTKEKFKKKCRCPEFG